MIIIFLIHVSIVYWWSVWQYTIHINPETEKNSSSCKIIWASCSNNYYSADKGLLF